jgi:membrane protein DedA with SNARE-associated domain
LPWYYAGKVYGKERLEAFADKHARWMTVTHGDIEHAMAAFEKHGKKVVLLGRLIPAIRTLISVPAGLAKMSMGQFLLFSTIGSLIWTGILTGAGYALESQYERVAEYVDPVSKAVLIGLLGWYLYRVVTFKSRGKT